MDRRRHRELPLTDYAVIGDGRTAALVAKDGSIDWLCYPRFDSPAVFCRLLDMGRGGYLQVAPTTPFSATRRYVGRTNVLATELQSAGGKLRLIDFMPLEDAASDESDPVILRKIEGLSGSVEMIIDFVPTFDFARTDVALAMVARGCEARSSRTTLRLSSAAPLVMTATGATSSFALRAGEVRWLALTDGSEPPSDEEAERSLSSTLLRWERWAARANASGPYADAVRRSALLLKLVIHRPTGGMVAAPTTSLPESMGGVRNWDYRFTWLRDASWLVSALMDLGYHDESMAFIDWLEVLDLGKGKPSIFYNLDGHAPEGEQELEHLDGYRGARPVRVGNAASQQDQHDVFGEVVAAIHLCSEAMPSMRPLRPGLWQLVSALADAAAEHWRHADHGIWEQREPRQQYLSSKLLCWVALDRALAMASRDGLSGPLRRWAAERDELRAEILRRGFGKDVGAFTRVLGQADLDASALLLPRYDFLPATDPRMLATVDRVIERLEVEDGLLRRYVVPDGLPGTEGAFVACGFWLVDCLARQGRLDEAHRRFERVLSLASDVGLLSEEIWPATGELLGNYPQAFSHLALIRAAVSLAEAEGTREHTGARAEADKAEGGPAMKVRKRLVSGMGAGLLATLAMSAVMLAAKRAGLMGTLPPRRITERMLDSLRVRRSEGAERLVAAGAHLGFGIGSGAAYSVLGPHVRFVPPVLKGAAFGALVWTASYLGWVPGLGLLPWPTNDRPGRPSSMLVAHLVFGAVLGYAAPSEGRA